MKYLSTAEMALKWDISQRRVSALCSSGRIKNAMKTGKMWLIPENATKPCDARFSYNTDISDEDLCVSEPEMQVLSIDADLLKQATGIFALRGMSVSDAINAFLYKSITKKKPQRIGIAEGKIMCCDYIDFCNSEIEKMFGL